MDIWRKWKLTKTTETEPTNKRKVAVSVGGAKIQWKDFAVCTSETEKPRKIAIKTENRQ